MLESINILTGDVALWRTNNEQPCIFADARDAITLYEKLRTKSLKQAARFLGKVRNLCEPEHYGNAGQCRG